MKLSFKKSGGFAYLPALSKPVIIDTDQVDPQIANQLESLLQDSHFFDQPATINTLPKGAADYQTYTISVEEGSRAHTIELTDPFTDANLARLVSFLEDMARPPTRSE